MPGLISPTGGVVTWVRRLRIVVALPQCRHLRLIRAAEGRRKGAGPGVLIEKLIPGHLAEARPSSRKEPSKTMPPSRVTMPHLAQGCDASLACALTRAVSSQLVRNRWTRPRPVPSYVG